MKSKLNPIWIILAISMILHIASIVGVVLIYAFQNRILASEIYHLPDHIILPGPVFTAAIAIIFGLHLWLTAGYRRAINRESEALKKLSIISFVFVVIVIPTFNIALQILFSFDHLRIEDHIMSAMLLRSLASTALILRNFSMHVLLIASAMLFYYSFIGKNQNDSQCNE